MALSHPTRDAIGNFSKSDGTFYAGVPLNFRNCGIGPEATMNGLIYLVGLIVVIMFVLSFLGLH
jgi:hypothetical protein